MSKYSRMFVLLVFMLSVSDVAHACYGTPLMVNGWGSYLVFGMIIGIMEGELIARFFQADRFKSLWIMFLANCFSTIVSPVLTGLQFWLLSIMTKSFGVSYMPFLLMHLASTVILEWRFCYWILKDQPMAISRSFKACFYAQIVSWAVLVLVSFIASLD